MTRNNCSNQKSISDLTDELQALRARKQNLQIILDSIGDAVLVTDIQGHVTQINPVAQQLTGYNQEQALGRPLWEIFWIINARTGEPVNNPVYTVLRTGRIVGLANHTLLISRTGQKYQIADSASPVLDHSGNINGVVLVFRDVTKEYESQQALQESEAKFRNLAQTTPMAILLYQDDKWIYVNPAAEQITGYNWTEFQNMHFWEVVHPDYRELVRKRGQARQEGQQPQPSYEFKILTKQGQERWVHLSGSSTTINERPAGLITVQDITKRKEIEEDLRRSEQKYRTILENMAEAYFETDLAGNITFFNPALSQLLGYTEPELQGMNHRQYTSRETARRMFRTFNNIYRTGQSAKITDYPVFTKQGQEKVVEMSTYLKQDKLGQPVGFWGIGRDVTQRKKTEQKILQSQQAYKAIFETTGTATVILEEDATISMVNKEFEKLSGYPKHELEWRRTWPGFVHEKDRGRLLGYHQLRQHNPAAAPKKYEFTFLNRQKKERYIICTVDVIPGTKKCVASLLDYTEQQHAQEERARLETQLRQSQKMEAIGTLAGGIAHDFNNILQGLSGNLQLCLNRLDPDLPEIKNLQSMQELTERASELVQGLLTFSRKGEVRFEAVDLNKVLGETLSILQWTMPKILDIECSPEPDLEPIIADYTQVQQVIMNLISNARDAFDLDQPGKIIISAEKTMVKSTRTKPSGELPPGEYALLTIQDNGKGIPEHIRERIFDPFFSTKESGQGTGLGLSIVYGIMQAHNGAVSCSSQPGRGTRFMLYFPLADEHVQHTRFRKNSAREPVQALCTPVNKNILVIDDEELIQEVTREALHDAGYTVHTFSSGQQALQFFQEKYQTVDLVLLDLNLPGISGEKILQQLLQICPEVRVLIISGLPASNIAREPASWGAADFLQKPFKLQEMLHKVHTLLS